MSSCDTDTRTDVSRETVIYLSCCPYYPWFYKGEGIISYEHTEIKFNSLLVIDPPNQEFSELVYVYFESTKEEVPEF